LLHRAQPISVYFSTSNPPFMKLSDFTRPPPCATAVSAVTLATVSSAYLDARDGSLEPVPDAGVAAPHPPAISFSAPRVSATYALVVQ
jgi:hypothetical protein